MANKALPLFTTPEDFLFRTPPYDVVQLTGENMITCSVPI